MKTRKHLIVVVWVVAALLFMAAVYEMGVMRPEKRHGRGSVRPTTYSAAPGGYKALYLWLQALELPVVRWEKDLRDLSNGAGVLVLVQPRFALEQQEIKALLAWIHRGGVFLLVADASCSLFEACGMQTVGAGERNGKDAPIPIQPGPYTRGVREILSTADTGVMPAGPEGLIHIEGPGDIGLLVVRELGKGRIIALADPEILCNRKLRQGDHPRLAMNLLMTDYRHGPILIDEYHHGYGRINSVLGHLSRSRPAKPILLGLLLFLCIGIRVGKRFGTPRPAVARTRRSSMEYVQAMARLLQRTGSRSLVLESYVRWTKAEARRLLVANDPVLQRAIYEATKRQQLRKLEDRVLLETVKGLHRALMQAKHGSEAGEAKPEQIESEGDSNR